MPRPRPAVLLTALATAAAVLTGCSTPQDPAPTAGTPSAAAPSAGPSAADDPPGSLACGRAVKAVRDGSLMTSGVVPAITAAAGTADAPVADAAQTLATAYTKAVAAHDTEAEPDAVAAVSAAAADLVKICSDSGLETTG